MNIRGSALVRGLGVGIATLQGSAATRTHTLVTAYAVGHAVDPDGFEVVPWSGPVEPPWAGEVTRAVSSGAAWVALHSALVPLARRSRYPLPLVALGYAVAEAVTDSLAAEWVSRQNARAATRTVAQPATEPS